MNNIVLKPHVQTAQACLWYAITEQLGILCTDEGQPSRETAVRCSPGSLRTPYKMCFYVCTLQL